MDKLTTLAISYPDFQLNQIIDPEQMDLNNLQIVNKINNIIKAFNELIQGTSGAGNITIAPIPEFSDATTVQQALQQIATFAKNLDTETARQFREVVEKNNQQDSKITAIENLNRTQDSRLNIIEDKMAGHAGRISVVEQKNITQDNEINAIKQKNNEQDGRLTTAEGTIRTHTTQIQSINAKDAEQDRRISGIESREELDTAFVKKIEKRVGVNETDIQKLQEDFAQLEGKDPVAELIVARTSGHTQETFRTLGDRLDHNEIPVKTDFTGQLRGAVNFRIVDENTTETWENHVKLGDITLHDTNPEAHETQFSTHNNNPTAHEAMMAEHEMDETSHSDIREKIATHETSETSHSDIREKIRLFGEKDLELDNKINVLSKKNNMITYFSYSQVPNVTSQWVSLEECVKSLPNNCIFNGDLQGNFSIRDDFPTTSGVITIYKTTNTRCYIEFNVSVNNPKDSKKYYAWFRDVSEPTFVWQQIATTNKTEILFTPEPDVKISYNNSYKINNTMFFRLTFEKSDGSYFEASEKVTKLCTSSVSVGIGSATALPLSTSVYDDNGNPIPCSSCSISNTILYIPSIPNKCRRIQISGVSVI